MAVRETGRYPDVTPVVTEMRWGRHPGAVWTLIAWSLLSGLDLLFAITFPSNGKPPDPVSIGTCLYAGLVIVVLLILADRTPRWLLWAMLSGAMISTTLLLYGAVTPLGGALFALPFIVYTSYAALWGSRLVAVSFLVTAAVMYLAVLSVRDALPGMLVSWFVIITICTGLVALLSTLVSSLRRIATTDPLTRLLNRFGLQTVLELSASRGRRIQPRSIVVFDLDGLKQVNDTYGHQAGDRLLAEFASSLSSAARDDDILARTGGDEFVVVLYLSSALQVGSYVDRVSASTDIPFSHGVAAWPEDICYDDAIARADQLMYEVKNARG